MVCLRVGEVVDCHAPPAPGAGSLLMFMPTVSNMAGVQNAHSLFHFLGMWRSILDSSPNAIMGSHLVLDIGGSCFCLRQSIFIILSHDCTLIFSVFFLKTVWNVQYHLAMGCTWSSTSDFSFFFASSVHFLCVSPARFVNIILLIGILIGAQWSPYYVRVSALLSLSSFRFFHLPTIKSLCDLLREDTSRLFYSLISACAGRETYF